MKAKNNISNSNSARLSVEGRAEPLIQTALDLYLLEQENTKIEQHGEDKSSPEPTKKEVQHGF